MTDRDRLAADLRNALYEQGLLDHDDIPKEMAKVLIALGWSRLDEDFDAVEARQHAEHVHDETHDDPEMCGPECAPFLDFAPTDPSRLDEERLARATHGAAGPFAGRHLTRLRRIANEAERTYVGRHWPSMGDMRRDGIGFGLVESRTHERFIRRYLDTFQPAFVVVLLDGLAEASNARIAALANRLDLDGKPFCPTGYAQRYHAIGECECRVLDEERLARALHNHACADACSTAPIKCGHRCAAAIAKAYREDTDVRDVE